MQRPQDDGRGTVEDARLVLRCQLGERAAFDALIERWAAPIAGYARRVTQDGDAAAELAQDVWLRVFRGIGRLREPKRFRAWLFGIAHRAFADSLRKRYAARAIAEASELADAPEPDHVDAELVERGLERLPPIEREILTLFYLQELSIAEVAEALGIASGTVKSRLHRARHQLRQELETQGELS
ncbi:RNA polymerase sigma factor [Sphingomonas sp.]|uniref:RNA polymerase sigma factor n=1 Tax=Sphingomonas sp. TaxID=28214 RepID=UPI0031CFCF91